MRTWLVSGFWEHVAISKLECKSFSFYRDVAGEVLATFYLMSIQAAVVVSWGDPQVQGSNLQGYLAMGCAIFILIEAFGQYGGAHMNPAVTVAFLFEGRISIYRACCYIPGQLLGATGGAWFVYFLVPAQYRGTLSATVLHEDVTIVQGVFTEIWVTAFLMTVIFNSMNQARRPVYMNALPIGLSVFVAGVSGAKLSGASMNPARSFGPALVMNIWKDHWIYWVGPISGALLATFWTKCFFDRIGHPNAAIKEEIKKSSRSKEDVGRPAELEELLEGKVPHEMEGPVKIT